MVVCILTVNHLLANVVAVYHRDRWVSVGDWLGILITRQIFLIYMSYAGGVEVIYAPATGKGFSDLLELHNLF